MSKHGGKKGDISFNVRLSMDNELNQFPNSVKKKRIMEETTKCHEVVDRINDSQVSFVESWFPREKNKDKSGEDGAIVNPKPHKKQSKQLRKTRFWSHHQ